MRRQGGQHTVQPSSLPAEAGSFFSIPSLEGCRASGGVGFPWSALPFTHPGLRPPLQGGDDSLLPGLVGLRSAHPTSGPALLPASSYILGARPSWPPVSFPRSAGILPACFLSCGLEARTPRGEDRHCDPSPRHGEASGGRLLAAFLGQVVTHLHPHPMFGVAPSNPFQRQCHWRRDTGMAVQQP